MQQRKEADGMKSIKPGRGPSMMGGIGSVLAVVFGVFWMLAALSMGAPPFFAGFGLIFIGMAAAGAVYNFKNAVSKNRCSVYDVVDASEEPDPLNVRFGGQPEGRREAYAFCPYCGAKLDAEDNFCGKCGKQIRKG